MRQKFIQTSAICWLLLFIGFFTAHGQSVAINISGSANGQPLSPANAGTDISQTSSNFKMAATAPTTGTGTWSIVSGTATITNPLSAATTVTGVPVGTSILRWTVTLGNCSQWADVKLTVIAVPTVSIKVFLEGPFDGLNLMKDNLRKLNLIPLTEPYTGLANFKHTTGGGEVIDPAVLSITGNNAIIDWIFLELRNESTPDSVSGTRSALLQADGDVVDTDGISPVSFKNFPLGNYFIIVRHRNHLTIKTNNAVALSSGVMLVDFTTKLNSISSSKINEINNFKVMRGGDLNADKNITAFDILKVRLANTVGQINAYKTEDVNMDGQTTAFDILIVRKNNKFN